MLTWLSCATSRVARRAARHGATPNERYAATHLIPRVIVRVRVRTQRRILHAVAQQ